ncbi:nucleotidyl transferase AbiEii/AbiGii toxin family protein [Natronogracilivirga saccharolytica]|uniref:Nucleotidyl transferase AbiEii/AbiGii toxin family protein n=1 Tax=Natronogracilivirga saccharolytica TaxID=2812953 RepID=A0A8J7S9N4_9BACT|nr:nucleotidyl transferase AbiEii/AbiGii toxin family protein [Natronogracilivirga saccharolytica]MBP3192968.1 nucleotidyl transferase AbiEii/AbiGii toxin family protein [Natronogracilivirga saccharolytica]
MDNKVFLQEWFKLTRETRVAIFTETARRMGLPVFAVEKDWWVVHTLRLLFSLPVSSHMVFKGGTSLSKGWKVIERFSEDIDLALDRSFLGFDGDLGKKKVSRLRRASYDYISGTLIHELQQAFDDFGFHDVSLRIEEVQHIDQDPLVIEIYYPKLTETDTYLKPGVLLEVGSRSLKEPFTIKPIISYIGEQHSDRLFADQAVGIPVVNAERTLLEKVFLLHEEHQRPMEKRRLNRLSRHLYDIYRLSQTSHCEAALKDSELYRTIVNHRSRFVRLSGVDYSQHQPKYINFIPPEDALSEWKKDYSEMRENMIHTDSPAFGELIDYLRDFQSRLNGLTWTL